MLQHTEELEQALRDKGYRLTPQRILVLSAIQGKEGHISVEEIYEEVRRIYHHVNISTIYRTLELLEGMGLVTHTDLGEGKVRYHWAEMGQHHHLVCQRCGSMEELDPSFLATLESSLLRQHDFQANLSHLAIFGLCGRCAKAG